MVKRRKRWKPKKQKSVSMSFPVRLSRVLVDEIKSRGWVVSELMRQALEKALGAKVCPTCGQLNSENNR